LRLVDKPRDSRPKIRLEIWMDFSDNRSEINSKKIKDLRLLFSQVIAKHYPSNVDILYKNHQHWFDNNNNESSYEEWYIFHNDFARWRRQKLMTNFYFVFQMCDLNHFILVAFLLIFFIFFYFILEEWTIFRIRLRSYRFLWWILFFRFWEKDVKLLE